MDQIPPKKPKGEDLEVTGVSRSGRVRKKSSKLMDFESHEELDRSFNKKQTPAKKVEPVEAAVHPKKPKVENVFVKEDPFVENFDMEPSDSEYGSEFEQPANTTESSIDDSVESESEEEGFRKLDGDSKKKLVIKDGRIVRDSEINKFKQLPSPNKTLSQKASTNSSNKKSLTPKASSGGLSTFHHLGVATGGYESVTVSPPSPRSKDSGYKVNGIKPIDVAAHLKLLGESLTIIGERLKEHEGQIAVSGSLSVLLDSLLCALGPLLCLTQQIPELQDNCCEPAQLMNTLDNVAFIMPGL